MTDKPPHWTDKLTTKEKADLADYFGVPCFDHDCDKCIYLGQTEHEGKPYDLYICLKAVPMPTLIARYGSDGPDYTSFPVRLAEGLKEVPPIQTALQRAKEQKLI